MKNAYRKYLAKRLTDLRNERKLTQGQVAEKIGKNKKAYQAYEEGRAAPSVYALEMLSLLYGISIENFLYDSPLKKSIH